VVHINAVVTGKNPKRSTTPTTAAIAPADTADSKETENV
jgi:hypothetical protein